MSWASGTSEGEGLGSVHKAQGERRIFRMFAEISGLNVDLSSIQSREPPEPDISCLVDSLPVAFELVQAIDTGLAQRMGGLLQTKSDYEQRYLGMPRPRRALWDRKLGNALIHITFKDGAPWSQRWQATDRVLLWLEEVSTEWSGTLTPDVGGALNDVVASVSIRRGGFVGPCFDIDGGGWIQDPIAERLTEKLGKSYNVVGRLELLAYYELQPETTSTILKERVEAILRDGLSASPFQRVWIFDVGSRSVLLVTPGSPT